MQGPMLLINSLSVTNLVKTSFWGQLKNNKTHSVLTYMSIFIASPPPPPTMVWPVVTVYLYHCVSQSSSELQTVKSCHLCSDK